MSRAKEIIDEIADSIHKFEAEGLIKKTDEFSALDELSKELHKVRQVFERNEELE